MKKCLLALFAIGLTLALAGCGTTDQTGTDSPEETWGSMEIIQEETAHMMEEEEGELILSIDGVVLDVTWEDNEAVDVLCELAKNGQLEVQMSMYGGFEQVGSLGADLPTNDEQTTTQAGDIVLYQGNQIVVFYDSNSWGYTRLGHIEGQTAEKLEQLLGQKDVVLTLEIE